MSKKKLEKNALAVEQSTVGPLLHPSLEQLQDEQTHEYFSSALELQLIVLQPLLKVMTSSLVDSSEKMLKLIINFYFLQVLF